MSLWDLSVWGSGLRALCIDFDNPLNNPTIPQLRAVGADSVRVVLLNTPHFYRRYRALKAQGFQVAVVFALESVGDGYTSSALRYCQALSDVPPDLILVGNEMNAPVGSISSWTMRASNVDRFPVPHVLSNDNYLDLWNTVVPIFKAQWPNTPCFVGGLLGDPSSGYLDAMWPGTPGGTPDEVTVLDPLPDGLDIHYPDSIEVLEAWEEAYGLPVSVMETCYKESDVPRTAVVEWFVSVYRLTGRVADFTWSDTVVPGMGNVNANGVHLKAWGDLRASYMALKV